jgi:hypothetical protein
MTLVEAGPLHLEGPAGACGCPRFYVDIEPVTNARYDEWSPDGGHLATTRQ